MPDETIEADSLFQLNVLIWALFPLPTGAPVTPALRNLGYRLRYVEYQLPTGVGDLADVQAATPRIGPNPVADLVLERTSDDRYVLAECKASSYGSESTTAEQGRGLLLAGAQIRARLGVATGAAEACFVVPTPQAADMDTTISEMTRQLAEFGQTASNGGAVNVEVRADGVYIGRDDEPAGNALLPTELRPMVRVLEIASGEDPHPLYVVPWTPDASQSTDLTAFREKVRSELLSRLGRASVPGLTTVAFEDVLDSVSHGIYRHWRDKNSLHNRVFRVLGAWLRSLAEGDVAVSFKPNALEANLQTDSDRERLMETVRGAALPEKTPEGYQPTMFDDAPTEEKS